MKSFCDRVPSTFLILQGPVSPVKLCGVFLLIEYYVYTLIPTYQPPERDSINSKSLDTTIETDDKYNKNNKEIIVLQEG